MPFHHISEEKYDKLLEDMQEVVRKTIHENHYELECYPGYGPRIVTHMRTGFDSLLYNVTDNQINSEMLSAEIFDRLEAFMIGFNTIKCLENENYSIDDVVGACNKILDESLIRIISSKIEVDY